MRTPLYKTLAVLALGWLAFAAVSEGTRTFLRATREPPRGLSPAEWRWGSPPVRRLAGFLARARLHVRIPAGSRVALDGRRPGGLYRVMWAAYFLPDLEVVPATHFGARREAGHWLAPDHRLDEPWLELLYEDPGGGVYRVRPRTDAEARPRPAGPRREGRDARIARAAAPEAQRAHSTAGDAEDAPR